MDYYISFGDTAFSFGRFQYMKIGIDARLIDETGVGRYIRNLISEIAKLDQENTYVVFLLPSSVSQFDVPNHRWELCVVDVRWHTVKEQIVVPWMFMREHLDLLHVPYVSIPMFYPGKMVVTMHDLTNLHVDTGKATTLPLWQYKMRRWGYQIVLAVGLWRARRIFAVSETTKKELMDHFHVPQEKIIVTYEGVDNKLQEKSEVTDRIDRLPKKYFLYVGNVYPHKNVGLLLDAFHAYHGPAQLVFVGKEDFFYARLKQRVRQDVRIAHRVQFFGHASDSELRMLYERAWALVFPSRMEGFGLPALEALAANCPVICSDIPVFHEILGELPHYFKTAESLTKELIAATKHTMKTITFQKKAQALVARYAWFQTASLTLSGYQLSFRS